MNTRMNRNRLNLGAYILRPYARTEKHIRQIKECGLDFIVCMDNDRKALDLFAKYGLGACVVGVVPGWWGGNGDNAGTMQTANPFEKYINAAKTFEDHPAVWGIDIGDEPSALDFEYFEKIQKFVQTGFPMQFPYLNLYPNYASICENNDEQTVNQLGTSTYAEHIEQYCQKISLDYIMFDYYVYSTKLLGIPYMNYRCTYTHFIGFDNQNLGLLSQNSVDALHNGCFRNLRCEDGRQLIVGDFTGKADVNKKAVFVLAADDYRDEHNTSTTLKFRCEGRTILAHGGTGKLAVKYNKKTHEYSIDIKSNQGIFIEAI